MNSQKAKVAFKISSNLIDRETNKKLFSEKYPKILWKLFKFNQIFNKNSIFNKKSLQFATNMKKISFSEYFIHIL